MFDKNTNKKNLIELASVAGIMAFFFWMDRSFGVVNWLSTEVMASFPGLQTYMLNIAGVSFVGLITYSVIQRYRSKNEGTARKVLEDFLKQQDFIDGPTGLSNRLGFQLMLGELRNSEVMTAKSIVAFEIRNLDSIASIHGEETVSKIEKLYSEKLEELCRANDFAARAEKGRFYLLVNSLNEPENHIQVEKVLEAIKAVSANGFQINGIAMSALMNLAWLNMNKHQKLVKNWSEKEVVQRLDYMLYLSKSKKNESVEVYSEKMDDTLKLTALVESELFSAIKMGKIEPYFQPFIDLKTNKIEGFEILARWKHAEKGFIPPDIFVHIAEEIGVMQDLTLSMLRQACVTAKYWPENMKLAFNISPNELRNENTMDGFFNILAETEISPERVEIEITENAFLEEVGEITEAVARLKSRGIQISIDDFGTGFANLSHLKMLPFDKIKIDQSFVRDMSSNPASEAIVKNIIALGKSFGLPTVAEGIELGENRDTLQELGCSVGQGYLYAQALKGDRVLDFVETYQAQMVYLDKVA